jgi:hypothetical protein
LFEILGTPVTNCLKVTGNPVKSCLKYWQPWWFQVRSLPPVDRPTAVLSGATVDGRYFEWYVHVHIHIYTGISIHLHISMWANGNSFWCNCWRPLLLTQVDVHIYYTHTHIHVYSYICTYVYRPTAVLSGATVDGRYFQQYVHVHIHIYTGIFIHLHISIWANGNAFWCNCWRPLLLTQVDVHIYYTYTHIHTYTHTHIHVYSYICTYVYRPTALLSGAIVDGRYF